MPILPWNRTPESVQEKIRARREWSAAVKTAERLRATVPPRWPQDATKFLDLDRWLDVNLKRAAELGLIEAKGLKILDLGSGSGQFLFVCDTLGHFGTGVDLPPDALETPEREVYSGLTEAFRVPVIHARVSACKPLEVSGRFDLIVSFLVCFNNRKREDEWTRGEWEFFVEDMRSHLNPGGRLALRLNPHEEKFGPHGYVDRETTDFFASCGNIEDGKIMIRA